MICYIIFIRLKSRRPIDQVVFSAQVRFHKVWRRFFQKAAVFSNPRGMRGRQRGRGLSGRGAGADLDGVGGTALRRDGLFVAETSQGKIAARNVIAATGPFQKVVSELVPEEISSGSSD
jgi:hypothetical protein